MDHPAADIELVRHRFRVMGTDAQLLVRSRDAGVIDACTEVERWLHHVGATLTRFDPGSELERLNDSGRALASELLHEVLLHAARAHRATGGRFDAGVGRELLEAGYDRTFDLLDVAPAHERAHVAPLTPAERDALELPVERGASFSVHDDGSVTVERGRRIDLGGIAKGWAADRACDRLAGMFDGSCLVDLGGDIAVHVAPGEPAWPIGVSGTPGNTAHTVALAHGGLATSSQDRRVWNARDGRAHHVIDPRTGRPARTDVQRITVVHDTCSEAEVWATALMLVGMDAALDEAGARGLTVHLRSTSGVERWTGLLAALDEHD